MYLFYLDDSADQHYYVFSAIGIPEKSWSEVFSRVKAFRYKLRNEHGIHLWKELHAWKFLSGRGRPSAKYLSLEIRAAIFNEALELLASFAPLGVRMLNVAMTNDVWAFERLLNRVNRFVEAEGHKALLICDEGKEGHYIRLCRRMRSHNPVPSKFGAWADGRAWKNIPAEHIVEDPIFKDSGSSNLIQLADLCAFALLRMDVPTEPMAALGIHRSFPILDPICVHAANKNDPFGVIRKKS